jgi:hypothetical protein
MKYPEEKYFEFLKEKIVETMKRSYPEIPDSIIDWKGQNIFDFQEDLRLHQNENISEKWFYTHMKSASSKLPRIDILNILSKYAGFRNWEEFKLKNKDSGGEMPPDKSNRVFYLVPLFMLIALLVFYLIISLMDTQEYTFCFYDSDTKKPVENSIIEITVLADDESPVNYLCNDEGCFTIKTRERTIRFLVETPYFQNDTIVRTLNKFNRTENIKLKIDDYAVLIHYFSVGNVKDWQKRRDHLDQMLSDSVKIFQVLNNSGTVGMEMYNKWEFINKLSLPSSSLSEIEILHKQYNGEKIWRLRFKQNEINE